MISFPVGAVLMVAVLAVALGGSELATFLNIHSLVLVIGGTIAILALSTPMTELRELFLLLSRPGRTSHSPQDIHSDLMALIRKRDAALKSNHPLIVYAQDLWEKGVDSQMVMALLGRRTEELDSSTEKAVAALRNVAKYPPALGMTGTVIGLVSLFSHLTMENRQGLGPLLALAMTATFYGLILANVVLMPLADRLYVIHLSKTKTNEWVFKVLLLIHQEEATKVIEDELHAATQPKKPFGPLDRRNAKAPSLQQTPRKREALYEDPLQFLWAVSYSDLLMVMMSFFIIFFSMSDPENPNLKNVLAAVTEKLVTTQVAAPQSSTSRAPASTQPGPKGGPALAGGSAIGAVESRLQGENMVFSKDKQSGVIIIDLENDLYKPGQYALPEDASRRLAHALDAVKPFADQVVLTFVGHTDATPISHPDPLRIIDSNLVLSNLRATRAVEFALTRGFDPKQVVAEGGGEFSRNTRSLSLRISERRPQ